MFFFEKKQYLSLVVTPLSVSESKPGIARYFLVVFFVVSVKHLKTHNLK